jgi:hypothetical protein
MMSKVERVGFAIALESWRLKRFALRKTVELGSWGGGASQHDTGMSVVQRSPRHV